MLKRIASALFASIYLVGLLGAIAGCNTMHGAGEDIKQGGEKIKEEADEHK